jgi:hypothetical protein
MAGMSDAHVLCHFPVCTHVFEPHPPEEAILDLTFSDLEAYVAPVWNDVSAAR